MKSRKSCHVLALVCGMMCLATSCEKLNFGGEDVGDGKQQLVSLRVTSFEQVPFGMTRTEVADVCSRLSFLVYDQTGERIRKEDQQVGDDTFGQVNFMLAEGHYFLVVVAHSGDGNPTSTNARKIAFTNKTGFTDTFLYADSMIVTDQDVTKSLNLKRIAAMVRIIPNDPIPARADSIRFYYTGGSGTFDAVAGGWGVVNSKQTQWYAISHSEQQFEIYTIPHEGEGQELSLNVTTNHGNKSDAAIISEREIIGIPIKRNHITTCRGYLFSPVYQQDFTITIDDDWASDSIAFNF